MSQKRTDLLINIKEIFALLGKGKLRVLLILPTKNVLLQFLRYCFVGGVATIVDWSVLYVTEKVLTHYLIAAVAGFFLGLACNYSMSKLMVFNNSSAKVSPKKEFLAYAVIGAAGLLITLILMYIMTEWLDIYFMISKVVATIVVLVWNFMARKTLYI